MGNVHKLRVETPLENSFCKGGLRIYWHIDARKLRNCDTQIVSPAFELVPDIEFKIMLKAAQTGDKRKQAGFKSARGRGAIQLKCVTGGFVGLPQLTFRFSLKGTAPESQAREIVSHDFNEEVICCHPQTMKEWDFEAAVDGALKTFVVCLEVQPAKRM